MKIGILLTGTPLHTIFLKSCFDRIKKLDIPIVLGWDDYAYSNYVEVPSNIRYVIQTGDILGKLPGVKWQMICGFGKLKELGCTHCFLFGADTGINSPIGIQEIEWYLEDADFVSSVMETGSYYFDAVAADIDKFLDITLHSDSTAETHFTKYIKSKGYSHLDVSVEDVIGFEHFQYDFLNKVRNDKRITDIVGGAYNCYISGKFSEFKKELSYEVYKVALEYGSVFGDVRVIGYTLNSDWKKVTPIMDFNNYTGSRSVRQWFIDCANKGVDWVASCPMRVVLDV